jgi:hypothetical protein
MILKRKGDKKMLEIKFEEIKNQLTSEQIEAIELCHSAYFYAAMSDDYRRTVEEEKEALTILQTYFKNLTGFKCDFYNCNDTLIFYNEVR